MICLCVHSPADNDRPNAACEFKILTKEKSFYVAATSSSDSDRWFRDIESAARYIPLYISTAYQEFLQFKFLFWNYCYNSNEQNKLEKPLSVDLMAPLWVTDGDVLNCTICNDPFTLFNRRHHCRNW